jgi:hypothetical protein
VFYYWNTFLELDFLFQKSGRFAPPGFEKVREMQGEFDFERGEIG